MPAPSAPFWLALLAGIVAVLVLVASWSTVLVFAIGVAVSFFLVPIVNRLERRGMNRALASLVMVLIVVIVAASLFLAIVGILVNQGVAFLTALPGFLDSIGTRVRVARPARRGR